MTTREVKLMEGRPDPIRTGQGSTAKVAHLVPTGSNMSLCGMTPRHGWQRALAERVCVKCHHAREMGA